MISLEYILPNVSHRCGTNADLMAVGSCETGKVNVGYTLSKAYL